MRSSFKATQFFFIGHKRQVGFWGVQMVAPNPLQSYRERQAEKEAMQLSFEQQAQPQRKPSFVRQHSSVDPPEQAVNDASL